MTAAEQMLHRLLDELEEAGFGTDEPVDAADLVETMGDWYASLKTFLKKGA